MLKIINFLLLMCMTLPYIVSADNPAYVDGDPTLPFPQWGGLGLEVCDSSRCRVDGAASWLNFTIAQNNVNTVCTNLVGAQDAEVSYLMNERRTTCVQILGGPHAYKWGFDIFRNKCDDLFNTNLDFHTCVETLNDILDGYVTWCDGGKVWTIGGHEQVSCFMISSSAQQGLCPGTIPF